MFPFFASWFTIDGSGFRVARGSGLVDVLVGVLVVVPALQSRVVATIGPGRFQAQHSQGRRRAIVVPDMRVNRISAEARGIQGRGRIQKVRSDCSGGEDFSSSLSGLVRDGSHDLGVVASCIKEAVEFANSSGTETVVVVAEDLEGDEGEGEESGGLFVQVALRFGATAAVKKNDGGTFGSNNQYQ